MGMAPNLGKIGVWRNSSALTPEYAAALESYGYGTVWIGGSPEGDLELAEQLIAATSSLTVATGIVNIWKDDAKTVAASYRRIAATHPGRFLLGIGAGHREHTGEQFDKPYEALVRYLDELDAGQVPVSDRVLAALGPRVLRLAAERAAGAHPYLTTPEHTRQAREIVGTALLAPEQKVVVESDPEKARAIARPTVRMYLGLVNYTNNLRRLGFTDEDLEGSGSDRLIDALVAHGEPARIAERVREHLAAGADHVNIQVLAEPDTDTLESYRRLGEELRDA
jgi:probable F420-dependent oxidoreductase